MSDALKDLNKVIEISPNDKVAIADKDCLSALKMGSVSKEGVQSVDKTMYEKANVILTKLISYEKNEHLAKITHDSSIVHHHSQVIPSAHRTKLDKLRAIRRRKEQDRRAFIETQGGNFKKNDLRFRVQQKEDEEDYYEDEMSDVNESVIDRLEQDRHRDPDETEQEEEYNEEDTNYYKENIFNKEDFYLYRAVTFFYLGEYDKAISDFESSSGFMH